MHRTIFLVHTNGACEGIYPRIYYGNGVRKLKNDGVFDEIKHIKSLTELEEALRFIGMRQDPKCPISYLWEVDEFVEIFFDTKNENPSYRFLSNKEEGDQWITTTSR